MLNCKPNSHYDLMLNWYQTTIVLGKMMKTSQKDGIKWMILLMATKHVLPIKNWLRRNIFRLAEFLECFA